MYVKLVKYIILLLHSKILRATVYRKNQTLPFIIKLMNILTNFKEKRFKYKNV